MTCKFFKKRKNEKKGKTTILICFVHSASLENLYYSFQTNYPLQVNEEYFLEVEDNFLNVYNHYHSRVAYVFPIKENSLCTYKQTRIIKQESIVNVIT